MSLPTGQMKLLKLVIYGKFGFNVKELSKKYLLECLFIYTLFFNISVRDKAVSGEGLLPVPPQFPCLIST